jgi:NAD(P) transhydrogenase subunit alpha
MVCWIANESQGMSTTTPQSNARCQRVASEWRAVSSHRTPGHRLEVLALVSHNPSALEFCLEDPAPAHRRAGLVFFIDRDSAGEKALRMAQRVAWVLSLTLLMSATLGPECGPSTSPIFAAEQQSIGHAADASTTTSAVAGESGHVRAAVDYWSLLFVLALSTLIGLGVILKVSRLLHTPLMSLTNAISAIAVVGAIIVTGGDHPVGIRILGFIALFASTTNIVSGFMITDRMLKMFKQPGKEAKP